MKSLDDILAGFKREAKEDWIGLWAIVWTLRRAHPKATADEIRELSIDLIQSMLESGFVAASVSDKAYLRWPDQRSEMVVRRIENEWDALGREPDIGEIAWFGLPPAN